MKNDKIMIIVPHEDDELNLTGGLLNLKEINKQNCYITFVTNGDYDFPSIVREKEARKSAKYLGIPQNNLIFLGYPDTAPTSKTHIYHVKKPNIFNSKHNINKTYLKMGDEFHYKEFNKHSDYNYDSLLNDLIFVIQKYKPDILITNDFDSHPDHRCLSLIFEHAMEFIMKKDNNYRPKVFKSFAYPTAYKGFDDFNKINIESTKFKTEINSLCKMQNPFYKWNERVRFPVGEKVRKRFVLNNRLYKNLNKHRSQRMLLESYSKIINGDQIFWQRRTDNLALNSKISVSSGDSKYINDFMYFDCKNILKSNAQSPELDDASWIPQKNDKEKTIKFEFALNQNVSTIKIYQNFNSNKLVKNISVKVNECTKNFNLNSLISEIAIEQDNVKFIEIKILDKLVKNEGFSEIEIFSSSPSRYKFMTILNDDNFVYNKYYYDKIDLKIYAYDGIKSYYIDSNDLIFYQDNNKIDYDDLIKTKKKKFRLKIILKDDLKTYYEVLFIKVNKYIIFKNKIINLTNILVVNINIFYNRVINKLRKIIHKFIYFNKM